EAEGTREPEEDFSKLSVKELKQKLEDLAITIPVGIAEKGELVELLKSHKPPEKPKKMDFFEYLKTNQGGKGDGKAAKGKDKGKDKDKGKETRRRARTTRRPRGSERGRERRRGEKADRGKGKGKDRGEGAPEGEAGAGRPRRQREQHAAGRRRRRGACRRSTCPTRPPRWRPRVTCRRGR
ncbi:unnamed protein product, partial [Prorocentrum cordatum]